MRRLFIVGVVMLGGCGTFELGHVQPQAGKTRDQMQLDTLACKDKAHMESNSAGRQVGNFIAGMTIVGAPIAYEADKAKQREVFASCLQARGYTVTPPDGQAPSAKAPKPSEAFPNLTLDFPAGFEKQPIRPEMESRGVLQYAINRTTDTGTFLSAGPRSGITDMATYARTVKARQENALAGSQSTDIAKITVNGRPAYRYEVSGLSNNIKMTYISTVIEGDEQVCIVNSWTGSANFASQKPSLEALPLRVSGLR